MEIGPKDVRGWQIAPPINARNMQKKKNLCKPHVQNRVFIDWSKSAHKQTRQQRAGAIIFFAL